MNFNSGETIISEGHGYPSDIIAEHSANKKPDPILRLLDLSAEMAAAAKCGDTRKVRRLKAEKAQIGAALQRETASLLATAQARQIAPPRPGGTLPDLEKRAKRLNDEMASKQAQLAKAITRLSSSPESEPLLNQVDELKVQIEGAQAELRAVQARREELSRWESERENERQQAEHERQFEAALPAREKQRAVATKKIIKSWQSLVAGLSTLDTLRELLRSPRPGTAAADPLAHTYKRIEKETRGAVAYSGTRWTFNREVKK